MDADRLTTFVAIVLGLIAGATWALRAANRFLTDPDPVAWPLT